VRNAGHFSINKMGGKTLRIKKVHFTDIMPHPMGRALDKDFSKRNWTLQLWCNGQTEGYQVYFGKAVQVDNLYEYGFPHLYEKEDLVAFAENYYNRWLCREIIVKDLSASNRRRLFKRIEQSDLTLTEPVQITFHDKVFYKRQDSLWYGGCVATISYRGWKFELFACGDVYADLYDRQDGVLLFYVKDKNNAGLFAEELMPYMESDKALCAARRGSHTRYTLSMDHNNWWEGFAYDPAGQFHDLMWCLDSVSLFDAIVEILGEMDAVIAERA